MTLRPIGFKSMISKNMSNIAQYKIFNNLLSFLTCGPTWLNNKLASQGSIINFRLLWSVSPSETYTAIKTTSLQSVSHTASYL